MRKRKAGRGKGDAHRVWRRVHGWLGLLGGLVLLVQGVTGAMLSYEKELRNGLGDGSVGSGDWLSPEAVTAEAGRQLGSGKPVWLIWRESAGEPVWLKWQPAGGRATSYLLDPVTGGVLENSTRWHRRFEWVLEIHRRLGAGRVGQIVMGLSALALASLLVTGMVLQARRAGSLRRLMGFGGQKLPFGGASFWRRWHSVAGVWLTPVLLLIALTGPVWSFASYRSIIAWVTQSEVSHARNLHIGENAGKAVNHEAVLVALHGRVPGKGAMRVVFPEEATQPARYEWAPPEAPFENFRSRLLIDPVTGTIIREEPLARYTAAEKAVRWAYPLHTGFWGGSITQLLHAAVALSIPFFAATGGYLYLKRIRK